MPSYSNEPWSSPESDLTPEQFCSVCLIDLNESGAKKIKDKCYLPVKKSPGGPYVKAAIHAATGAHGLQGLKGVPAAEKKKAANKIIRLYAGMKEVASEAVYRIAGKKRPQEKKSK